MVTVEPVEPQAPSENRISNLSRSIMDKNYWFPIFFSDILTIHTATSVYLTTYVQPGCHTEDTYVLCMQIFIYVATPAVSTGVIIDIQ